MNLLLVDDERYIIEDLLSGMNWNRIGIDHVFTAMNVRQAKEVFEKEEIRIMLCDIEMPQASGLDLLRWITEKQLLCETILVTCHAEFSYAQEAIRLGATEYLLKPIDYDELENTIKKAMNKIRSTIMQKETAATHQKMKRNQPFLNERFWIDVLNRTLSGNNTIQNAASRRNVPLSPEMLIRPVLTRIQQWPAGASEQDIKLFEFSVKNIADELFTEEGKAGITFFIKDGVHIILMYQETSIPEEQMQSSVSDCAAHFINECKSFCGCNLSSYIGDPVDIFHLADEYDILQAEDESNVAYTDRVFYARAKRNVTTVINEKWIIELSALVNENREEELNRRARFYLESLARTTGIDSSILYWFQQDFTQMIYEKASHNGILPHNLLNDPESIILSKQASQSVEATLQWIAHISHKIINHTQKMQKSQSVVHTSAIYIKNHLGDDISREEVAAQAFLNPDYLDRIFKKETGMSVSKYITHEKVNLAKFLLTTTDRSIADIALQVGFSNMSNFASMFKRMTGLNPNEYRKQTGNQQAD
ncbi:MAG: helix-turn-helix domain-containing protein [Eubacteriales bacterium]|nr:helix-turn-helix domain-containing protein [Eubacteriales bacterium]